MWDDEGDKAGFRFAEMEKRITVLSSGNLEILLLNGEKNLSSKEETF